MTTQALKAVIFDMDGTLLNSLPYVLKALNHALEPYSDVTLGMDIFPSLGGPPSKFFHDLVRSPEHVAPALARLDQFHLRLSGELALFEGATELLHSLKAEGIALGIWTGRDRNSCLTILKRFKVEALFDVVVCGDDFISHKPEPEGMLYILKTLQLAPASVLFVGDADVDVQGGASSGVPTVLIRHGREVPEEIRSAAQVVVDSPEEAYRSVLARSLSGKS